MKNKKLSNILDLKNKDVVSVVGFGGKTTIINLLAKENENKNILVTTSTKIYIPNLEKFTLIKEELELNKINGIVVIGNYDNTSGKLFSISEKYFNKIVNNFDISLVESDGSKEKNLKWWNDDEPVIFMKTTKTIAVIRLDEIGNKISESNIHRVSLFIKNTNSKDGDEINLSHYKKIILSKDGIFKNSIGEKILIINGVNSLEIFRITKKLLNSFGLGELNFINKIIIGDAKKNIWLEYKLSKNV